MMSVEIRINGSIVAALCAIKIDSRYEAESDGYVGTYEYQGAKFPINNQGPCITVNGTVSHRVQEGIEVLTTKLCAELARAQARPG
jgi:hypothetical protein